MSLRYRARNRKPILPPSLEAPSPWRTRIICVLLGITAGAVGYHTLSEHEKAEEQKKTSDRESDSSHYPSVSEKRLADKLTQCNSTLSLQSLKIHDLRGTQRDEGDLLMNFPKSEKNEGSTAGGEDLIASNDQGYYLTELLSGVEVINDFERKKYPVVVRGMPIVSLRSETSKMDIPDDARDLLDSLFEAVENYQERPGNLYARCDMMTAVETIENLPDENAIATMHSSTMLNILLESVKQPGVSLEDLRDDFCDE